MAIVAIRAAAIFRSFAGRRADYGPMLGKHLPPLWDIRAMSEERRQSYRYRFEDGDRWVMLRIQRREFPARLLDESAGGFSVGIDGAAPVHVGDVVVVNASDLWCEARVVHQETTEQGMRLGLERLREQQVGPQTLRGNTPVAASHMHGRPRDFMTTVSLCIGVSLTVVALSWFFRPQLSSLFGGSPEVVFISPAENKQATMDFLSGKQDPRLNAGLQRLTLLRRPEFLERLQLTAQQQSELQKIVTDASKALELIYEETLEESRRKWSQRTMSALGDAEAEMLRVMSDEQKARWRELADATTKKP